MITAEANRISNGATARAARGLDGADRRGRALIHFAVSSGGQDVASTIRDRVLTQLERPVTAEAVSCGMSADALRVMLRVQAGRRFNDFVLKLRLDVAREWLLSNRESLGVAALAAAGLACARRFGAATGGGSGRRSLQRAAGGRFNWFVDGACRSVTIPIARRFPIHQIIIGRLFDSPQVKH
jgi:hypothetical protein